MEQLSLFQPLDRTERQKEGIRNWIKNKCIGTLAWATGVGCKRWFTGLNSSYILNYIKISLLLSIILNI